MITVLQHYTRNASPRYRWPLYGAVPRHTYIAIQTYPRNVHSSTPPHFYVNVIDQWFPKYAPHGIRGYISLMATLKFNYFNYSNKVLLKIIEERL